jgi:hypothetical protein
VRRHERRCGVNILVKLSGARQIHFVVNAFDELWRSGVRAFAKLPQISAIETAVE